jgi:S-adenosylmethionine decarboxylase
VYLSKSEVSNAHSTKSNVIEGLHIVANLRVKDLSKLIDYHNFKQFIDQEIANNNLTKVGEAYHDFPGGGYTGVVCLTESHLSVHTWPEKEYLTFDVFLSNHLKDNRSTTTLLYQNVKLYFEAVVLFEQIIKR